MKVSEQEITAFLETQPGWTLDKGKLYRQFMFESFAAAFGFMSQIAIVAEKQDHHPDWKNSYRTVDIWLTTHQHGGITQRDFTLAESISKMRVS